MLALTLFRCAGNAWEHGVVPGPRLRRHVEAAPDVALLVYGRAVTHLVRRVLVVDPNLVGTSRPSWSQVSGRAMQIRLPDLFRYGLHDPRKAMRTACGRTGVPRE